VPLSIDTVRVAESVRRLRAWVEARGFRGYEVYDALSSPLIRRAGNRWIKIAATQFLRRSPVNVRPLLGIRRDYNPKGMGLFLAAYVKLYRLGDAAALGQVEWLADWLLEHRSRGYRGAGWGYNWDWQSRAFFLPKGTPTVVNTAFVGHAFLDAWEAVGKPLWLETARSACDFVLEDLRRTCGPDGSFCFSYTPIDDTAIHNANYLGASLLARVGAATDERRLVETAAAAYDYSTRHQRPDGSWPYAETTYQTWVDSYHTGFNLEALLRYGLTIDPGAEPRRSRRGCAFYVDRFFRADGAPRYYHDRDYPVDIHSPAQAFVTLSRLREFHPAALAVLGRVLDWTLRHMQDRRGYFYFRRGRILTNRIPYIRWGQAWAMHGLTTVLLEARASAEAAAPTRVQP